MDILHHISVRLILLVWRQFRTLEAPPQFSLKPFKWLCLCSNVILTISAFSSAFCFWCVVLPCWICHFCELIVTTWAILLPWVLLCDVCLFLFLPCCVRLTPVLTALLVPCPGLLSCIKPKDVLCILNLLFFFLCFRCPGLSASTLSSCFAVFICV